MCSWFTTCGLGPGGSRACGWRMRRWCFCGERCEDTLAARHALLNVVNTLNTQRQPDTIRSPARLLRPPTGSAQRECGIYPEPVMSLCPREQMCPPDSSPYGAESPSRELYRPVLRRGAPTTRKIYSEHWRPP